MLLSSKNSQAQQVVGLGPTSMLWRPPCMSGTSRRRRPHTLAGSSRSSRLFLQQQEPMD